MILYKLSPKYFLHSSPSTLAIEYKSFLHSIPLHWKIPTPIDPCEVACQLHPANDTEDSKSAIL